MIASSISAVPEAPASHPMRPMFITVLAAKVAVAAFLLATASFAPPVSADQSYSSASTGVPSRMPL
ncbi:hypothetical protein LH464_02580 [Neorhizobium sp. T786]|uniref:hypothetical protein n=1 Tax=Pseudorhizobium xiangyangii TaxID=2883104 RepID=UPI001CFFDCE6|nr:hypothetical protein [Neorhizobium xiangyangii]MCB5201364.1 hypothetical protein [Neorhizobium xiangyangii]